MCSIIAGLSILATAASGYMQYEAQQAQAEQQAAAYKAQAQNQRNQAIAEQHNAQIEGKKQEQIADQYAREGRELRDRRRVVEGAQKAQTGAAGIGFSGSALDLLAAGNEAYAQDQLTLQANQANANWDSRQRQMNHLYNADAYNVAARNSEKDADYVKSQAKSQGLATILGTAVSVAGTALGAVGGGTSGGGSSYTPSTVSTDMGYGTTSSFSPSTGKYTFSSNTNLGNLGKTQTYFPASKASSPFYKTGNWF